MSIQEVKDAWIYLDRNTGIWRGELHSAQGVFQPIHWVAKSGSRRSRSSLTQNSSSSMLKLTQ